MEKGEGKKRYNREEINKIATQYDKELEYDETTPTTTTTKSLQVEMSEEPEFLLAELQAVIKNLKRKKEPGNDNIINEQIKNGGKELMKTLTILFYKILKSRVIPEQWKITEIILIFKKGNIHQIKNYRPISLSPTIAKSFLK